MPPSRKTNTEKIADLEARASVIKNRIDQLKAREKAAERKRDARRKIVIGGAVLAEMQNDAAFHNAMIKLLQRRVTRENDLNVIIDILQTGSRSANGDPASKS